MSERVRRDGLAAAMIQSASGMEHWATARARDKARAKGKGKSKYKSKGKSKGTSNGTSQYRGLSTAHHKNKNVMLRSR